jgi:hypothetical protein
MYQVRINYRLGDSLETHIVSVEAKSLAAAKRWAKNYATELSGRLVDVIPTGDLVATLGL